jgi:hypothetical protein
MLIMGIPLEVLEVLEVLVTAAAEALFGTST